MSAVSAVSPAVLSLRDLTVSRGGRTVLEGLSAAAGRGDVVALCGPNGAGKSTLLHCLAGVLKNDAGEIRYRDEKIDPRSPGWRRRLSYVLDDGGIIPLLTPAEQLYLQGALSGLGRREAAGRAGQVIDLLELDSHRDYRGDELSSGLRKRLGIGLGIVRDAEVFLFDEPYSSLDSEAAAVFDGVLRALKRKGRIVVVAAHGFSFPGGLYNRVWTLSGGTLEERAAWEGPGESPRSRLQPVSRGGRQEIELPWLLPAT